MIRHITQAIYDSEQGISIHSQTKQNVFLVPRLAFVGGMLSINEVEVVASATVSAVLTSKPSAKPETRRNYLVL